MSFSRVKELKLHTFDWNARAWPVLNKSYQCLRVFMLPIWRRYLENECCSIPLDKSAYNHGKQRRVNYVNHLRIVEGPNKYRGHAAIRGLFHQPLGICIVPQPYHAAAIVLLAPAPMPNAEATLCAA